MRMTVIGILFRLIVFIVLLFNVTSAQEITGIYGHPVSDTMGQLLWFVEGINESEIRHDDNSRDYYLHVSTENISQRVAVKFDNLNPPLVIKSVKAFIYEYDLFPDLDGDALSPFNMSVYDSQEDHPGDILAGPVQSHANGIWSDGGEWVEAGIEYLLTDIDVFWAQFTWLDSLPSAPVLGLDLSTSTGKSIVGYDDNGMNWQYCYTGNIMIRASILENDLLGEVVLDSNCQMPDSFRIYSANHDGVSSSDEFYLLSITDSLHCDVNLSEIDNYFVVTAFYGGVECDTSEIVYIPGVEKVDADVALSPELIELRMTSEDDTSFIVTVSNLNGSDLEFRVRDIEDQMPDYLYSISIMTTPSVGMLASAETDTIDLLLTTGQVEVGEYQIPLTIDFWDSARQYKSKQIDIVLNIDQATSAEDEGSFTPDRISLLQNYPNPFNSSTVIPYSIPDGRSDIYLEIYNLLGKKIYSVNLNPVSYGCYFWDGRNMDGQTLSSGIYLYKLRGYPNILTRKLIYLK